MPKGLKMHAVFFIVAAITRVNTSFNRRINPIAISLSITTPDKLFCLFTRQGEYNALGDSLI